VTPFITVSLVAIVALVATAAALRSRSFAVFVGFLLGLNLLITAGLEPQFGAGAPVAWYLQGAATLHFAALLRARLRGNAYRLLISFPAHFWMAGTFLAFPWAIATAFGLPPLGWWLPFLAALFGLSQSLRASMELVELHLDGSDQGDDLKRSRSVQRHPIASAPPPQANSRLLRVVQITDPHLGPFMSEARLHGICERAVAQDPALVLLTGDFFTMEGAGTEKSLERAMAPLKDLPGRVFACRGNHDLEVPDKVADELAAIGARLLIDEAEMVETSQGPVQLVGLDHIWRGRSERFAQVLGDISPGRSVLRIVLLHDPTGFIHLPPGTADLVLSGHTHGGHLGLISLGLDWTTVGAIFGVPDHGFWSRGRDRMYVHRANGHYGFPLRIGVPAEESVLRLVLSGQPPPMERPSYQSVGL
jgi:predicted MPP superfamily phosphohydrolase